MLNVNQKTINEPILFSGIGLHSGLVTAVKLLPASDNSGIIFKRTDIKEKNIIKANFNNVSSAKLCTTLENSYGISVSTVEHLLAAFYITGVDNIIVEVNNKEMPIMDGSSKDFVNLIKKTGLKELNSKRKFLKILKPIELKENKKSIFIEPNDQGLTVDFQINFNNEVIGDQNNFVNFQDSDLKEIYTSRTFCLFEDIEKIKKKGLAKGGSLNNAIVVKGNKVLNKEGLRNKKEFVNHKILDLAGDFLLSGYRVLGSVKCVQGGHLLTNTFLKKILKDSSNFKELTANNLEVFKKDFKTPINKLAVNA